MLSEISRPQKDKSRGMHLYEAPEQSASQKQRMDGGRHWLGRERLRGGGQCLTGTEFQYGKMESSRKMVGTAAQQREHAYHHRTEHLTMVNVVSFT